jgi:hypothetical protein
MSSSDWPARRFLVAFTGVTAALLVALLGLTWSVDPTGLLRRAYGGTKLCAAGPIDPVHLLSANMVEAMDWPPTIWLGSSRVANGFVRERAANLGLPSASMAEIATIGRNAVRSGRVRTIRIGLELGQFTNPDRVVARTADNSWFAHSYPALRHGLLDDRAIVAALRGCEPVEAETRPVDRQEAQLALAHTLTGVTRLGATERATFYQAAMAELAALLAEARASNVRVTLWIGPNRSTYWPALARADLLPVHTRWRRDLATLARRHNADMLDIDRLDTPDLVCNGSTNRDCHFLDATHYSPDFGAQISRTIATRDAQSGRK